MTNAKHTPGPWEVVNGDEGEIFIYSNGCDVAELYADNADCMETVEADAALIVQAVNSYDAMREALESAEATINALVEDLDVDDKFASDGERYFTTGETLDKIHAALALARK